MVENKKTDIYEKCAIVQNDGVTYAVAPHTPAGLLTPAALRKIADVAEKYNLPVIKITTAQRIALV
ncbi:MAG: NAD(P)/FAD-dependent oxidoreductase, partial [Methanosarcinales archaeon]|nr:NAD(P)/FAD-dependent oxidoreductase [Methanosarcinales archaeon]